MPARRISRNTASVCGEGLAPSSSRTARRIRKSPIARGTRNPSAIVVTLYLLSRERVAAGVAIYIAAIFLTYLTLGALVMSGIDVLLPSVGATLESRLGFIVQGAIGLAMLLYAIRTPSASRSAMPCPTY